MAEIDVNANSTSVAKAPFRIPLEGILLVSKLEEALLATHIPSDQDVLVDLAEVTYVESTALTMLVALVAKFESQNNRITFNFPQSRDVRDILRTWKFPDAVAMVSRSKNLRYLTTTNTQRYWGESPNTVGAGESSRQSGMTPLVSIWRNDRYVEETARVASGSAKKRYWPIQVFDREKQPFTDSLAMEESDFWSGPLMLQVMTDVLGADANDFASDVVFEAMANAVRHPGATKIVTTSHAASRADGRTSHFTGSWWDDGTSIVDTLREPLRAGKPIRTTIDTNGIKLKLTVVDESGNLLDSHSVDESIWLSNDTTDELLLVAAFMPGITRDPTATPAIASNRARSMDSSANGSQPGMGLFYLLGAAIDVYGGSVSIRTKNLFLNLKRRDKRVPRQYKAKIIKYPFECSIPGNMITVRLNVD